MKPVILVLVCLVSCVGFGQDDETKNAKIELEFGPKASFAIMLRYALTGEWDEYMAFGVHSSEREALRRVIEERGGRDKFIGFLRRKKIPLQVRVYKNLQEGTVRVFQHEGETVALLRLKKPFGGWHGLLMYKDGDHFSVKNSSILKQAVFEKFDKLAKMANR